jgi:hypothetical protein
MRFKGIEVDSATEVGASLTWDKAYAALDSYGVIVVGASTPGVRVSGGALGGGRPLSSASLQRLSMIDTGQVIPGKVSHDTPRFVT